MSKDTPSFKLLYFLLNEGQTRYNDILFYLISKYADKNSARRGYLNLLKKGYIVEAKYRIDITNKKNKMEVLVALSRKGINYILDELNSVYYFNNHKAYERINRIRNEDKDISSSFEKVLQDKGVKLMFYSADIPVFKKDKPSLSFLRETILNNQIQGKEEYRDNLNCKECKEMLHRGIYYSNKEVREYFNEILPESYDITYGTRNRGIFISESSCLVVYVSKRYENKIIRVNLRAEKMLLNLLNITLKDFTNIYRHIPLLDTIKQDYFNEPYALIFSDGDMLAYSTATGKPRGKAKGEGNVIGLKALELSEYSRTAKAMTYLTTGTSLFSKLYVIPETAKGVSTLKYLSLFALEDMIEDGRRRIERSGIFVREESSTNIYPYTTEIDNKIYMPFYVPVFEAKALYEVFKAESNLIILTVSDLLNMIARTIRKDALYYDIIDQAVMGRGEVCIFAENGEPKGIEMIKNELRTNGTQPADKNEIFNIAKRLELSNTEFLNQIARGEIILQEILGFIKTKPYIDANSSKSQMTTLSISISKVLIENVKEKAREEGISTSKFISSLLAKALSQ